MTNSQDVPITRFGALHLTASRIEMTNGKERVSVFLHEVQAVAIRRRVSGVGLATFLLPVLASSPLVIRYDSTLERMAVGGLTAALCLTLAYYNSDLYRVVVHAGITKLAADVDRHSYAQAAQFMADVQDAKIAWERRHLRD